MQELAQLGKGLVAQGLGINVGSDEHRVVEDQLSILAVVPPILKV